MILVMDAEVDDFLNEINEIAPLSDKADENAVWEKCFDEETGFAYYWNTKTNEVTWQKPPDYELNTKTKTKRPANALAPPKLPLFPSAALTDTVKIYKIGEAPDPVSITSDVKIKGSKKSDKNNEGISLICSYGSDSDMEEEELRIVEKVPENNSPKNETRTVIIGSNDESKTVEMKNSTGFSLVAGYSDSEDDTEVESINTVKSEDKKVSYSTLFPIPQAIDVKDFEVKSTDVDFDSKAFQRKRRIGVDLVNTVKKTAPENGNEDRKGLGFSSDSNDKKENFQTSKYPGFKSGGVMFVKSDDLEPPPNENNVEDKPMSVPADVTEIYEALREKLDFLGEGHGKVLPVQVMLIQLETLFVAMKSGDLKQTYLRRWLEETCSDLVKLEKESAPEGWLLQWDRTHKRYYYQNATTGESQWEYPQVDVVGRDDAMDISTTPPPQGEGSIHVSPPLPPVIRSPSPPPPPTISDFKASKKKKFDIPLPVNSKEVTKTEIQPLPPGVESGEANKNGPIDMKDALSSFYSDIAAIETNNSPISNDDKVETPLDSLQEVIKKKKKTKVKLTQGIAMKKKGVSKLVEKWKNVQKSYND